MGGVCTQWDPGLFSQTFSYIMSWFHSSFLRLCRGPHTSRNMVTQGLIWSIVLTEVFAPAAPLSCHHLTTHTGIPKPPSCSQIVSDSIMFFTFLFLPFFFLLLASKESFIFPVRLLVQNQLQSLYSLSLELNFLSLNTEIPVCRKSPPSKARAPTRDVLPVFSH